ncbi:hypothetical protein GE061_008615 [Apolygus lucorum]|uniref:CUB domain-containing protein n=2 Tax=Apolygus lucorum TaxID=248454 RepID=A0A8S9WN26_APOLU|nr:hypothetical protein GE061_008615 [Apolygus lucorum]
MSRVEVVDVQELFASSYPGSLATVPQTVPPTQLPFFSTTQDIIRALDDDPSMMRPEISPKCEAFINGNPTKNTFYSPNYPDLYTNNTDCVKVIDAPPGNTLKLDFRDRFDIEPSQDCRFDSLEIRDGPNGYDKLIGVFCGSVYPPIIQSTGRSLWLRFKSDENIESRGFKGVYEFVPKSGTEVPEKLCRKELGGIEGYVNKSDIDQEFLDRSSEFGMPLECMWTITVEEGWKIQLQFNKFALEVPNDCESNFVDIFPEKTDLPSRLFNFCGSIADMVLSPDNILKIRFLALPRGMKSNFEALYTAFRDKPKSAAGCDLGEYDCEDATCISEELKCNGRINCRFRSDEDPSRCTTKEGVLDTILNTEHMIIILVVFFLILTGMCFAFLFNCFRKLVRDHRIIQEHMRRSREARLHEEGKLATVFPKRECYVPSAESLSCADHLSKPESSELEVEMKDSIAQTHESVFTRSSEGEDEDLAPISRVDFSTFGLGVRRNDEPRALSMDSTKSAPDVIITWNHRSTLL